MELYSYYRSSASYRVRIALNLKQVNYTLKPVHLLENGGEQFFESYRQLNPQSLVPTLITSEGPIIQSLAIIDYLEQTFPEPPLFPIAPYSRSQVLAMAQLIASDIHPLNNLRVLQYLKNEFQVNEEEKLVWYQHWLIEGFNGLELYLERTQCSGKCCFGDTPTVADLCLIPQMYNAKRFNCPVDDYVLLNQINEYCLTLPAFKDAAPEAVS